jgi:hypothetical protein
MWRESFGFVGAAIAVINGLIAIGIALLPVRRSAVKLRLGAAALALGALAIVATAFFWYDAYLRQERQLSAQREIGVRLDGLIMEGRALLAQINNPQSGLPSREADEWAQRAELYLRGKLGDIYVARFRREVSEMYGDAAVAPARLAYWRAVRNRLVNLEMISGELRRSMRISPGDIAKTLNGATGK